MSSQAQRRSNKFRMQGGLCHWCDLPMVLTPFKKNGKPHPFYATFEHVTPKSNGGGGMPHNVVLAHATCNRKRADHTKDFDRHVENMRRSWHNESQRATLADGVGRER